MKRKRGTNRQPSNVEWDLELKKRLHVLRDSVVMSWFALFVILGSNQN
jgi:hypothetical protein